MKRWGKQKPVHLDIKELRTDLGFGNFIFIGSSCDMFAKDIPNDWIWNTLAVAGEYRNKYLLQTKNPGRLLDFHHVLDKSKFTLCTTIETNWYVPGISENAPRYFDRAEAMGKLHEKGFSTMVTIEPIIDFEVHSMTELIQKAQPYQVNIGSDSGRNGLPEPPPWKVKALVDALEGHTIVHLKKNLNRLLVT
jgi:DNA repair photolyase